MRIHSFGLSKTPSFLGFWNIDFDRAPAPFTIPLKGDKNLDLFIEALRYLLFDIRSEKLGEDPRVELVFSTEEGKFKLTADKGSVELRKNGVFLPLSAETVRAEAFKLTHLDAQKLKDTLCLDVLGSQAFFDKNVTDAAAGLIGPLSDETAGAVLAVGEEVARQKSALLNASESVINEIEVLPADEEEKLEQQLIRAAQQHGSLQREINTLKESVDWLVKSGLLKEEVARLAKQQASVNADLARFEVKKTVLDKALKADALSADFAQLCALRAEEKEEAKQIGDLQRSVPMLSEKVRSANLVLSDAKKNLETVLTHYQQKSSTLERVRILDAALESDAVLIKQKKEELNKELSAAKTLQEENTRLKTLISQLTIKAQLLNKKMSDLSTDALLVKELDEYKENLAQIDAELSRGQQAEEQQRELQKKVEAAKAELGDVLNTMVDLKNEELELSGDLSMKERSLTKLIGHDSAEKLAAELKDMNERLVALDALQGRIALLADGHERFTREKAALDETRHALRLATVTLTAARQSFTDKSSIVKSAEQAYTFYLEVLALSEQRQKLSNGKPCPLCGAIHHPFSTKLPYDRTLEDKLAKAKADAREALSAVENSEQEFLSLQKRQQDSERLLESLNLQLEEAKGDILYIAGELSVTGLREKKPITWTAVIKQKQTSLANRRDDLANRLEKIRELAGAASDLKEKRDTVTQKIAAKKEEQAALENSLTSFAQLDQQLTKTKKETELNRVSLTRLLERSFARFGVKASTAALLKQNLPTLEKRREQWINWSAEKNEIEELLNSNSETLKLSASSLTDQKKHTDQLEKECGELQERIKKLQKERHEAIASQTPEEVKAAIEAEKSNAERLTAEAENSLSSKEEALNSCKAKIQDIEKRRGEILRNIEELTGAFTLKLHAAGFPNESSFLSSQISDAQKDELLRQNKELQERAEAANAQYAEKNAALNELLSLKLTDLSRERLEEELNVKSDLFHTATAQLSALRETMAKNANNKNRRKREEAEFDKIKKEAEKWKTLCLEAKESNDFTKLGLRLAVFFAADEFSVFETGFKIHLKDEGFVLKSEDGKRHYSELSYDDKFYVTLAVLLGRSKLYARRSTPEFVILEKSGPDIHFPVKTLPALSSLKIAAGISA